MALRLSFFVLGVVMVVGACGPVCSFFSVVVLGFGWFLPFA